MRSAQRMPFILQSRVTTRVKASYSATSLEPVSQISRLQNSAEERMFIVVFLAWTLHIATAGH